MNCYHVTLSFARKNSVDLYVIENHGTVDILTGNAPTRECFWASRLEGSVKEIVLDQHKKPILWESIALPDFCRSPQGDSRHNEVVPGHEPTLNDLVDDVANAMNRTINDRGFSRFVKKQIVGSWVAGESRLEFLADGAYRIVGSPGPIKYSPPTEGRWHIGGRMLHLMTRSNDRGVRVALVSVSESELKFHGYEGAIFHVYGRV